MPKRVRSEMTAEVREAVNDILHGTTVDSATEWLQREYIRLMRREAMAKSQIVQRESKLNSAAMRENGNFGTDRSTQQHSTKEHATGTSVDANNDN